MKTAAALLADRYPFVNELLTQRLVLVITILASAILATNAIAFAIEIAAADGYMTKRGLVLGGDFVVFSAAADAAAAGDAAAIYQSEVFSARLNETFPERGGFLLSWQYPPTVYFLLLPLAFLPYLAGYSLWVGATGGLFLAALRTIWEKPRALFLMIAAPAAFQAVITGQTGFLTAALLATCALFADRRPVLAGVAAGLLTFKPQLGLLIPFAFMAAGCWRAFAIAALTAIALVLTSLAVFGADVWIAFADAVTTHSGRMQSAIFPFHKLISVYGGAVILGVPAKLALAGQLAATACLMVGVALLWRRVKDADLRAAVLCAAAPLATPYAFYYEMPLLLIALFVVAKRGVEGGWLCGEKAALAILWTAPMFILVLNDGHGFPFGFATTLGVLALAVRRMAHDGGIKLRPPHTHAIAKDHTQ